MSVVAGRYSIVIFAETAHGDLAFRATADPTGHDQARVASLLAEAGAGPMIHDVLTTETGTWTVMDRVVPGIALREAASDTVRFEDVVAAFSAVASSRASCELPSLSEWLHARLRDDVLTDRVPRSAVASEGERERAAGILRELGDRALLCHGDAHPGNLLIAAGERRVLFIDPRGMSGDVAYDVGVFALKVVRYDDVAATAIGNSIAAEIGLDRDRVRTWITVAKVARV